MKKIFLKLLAISAFSFLAIDAGAARPVWILGHGLNSGQGYITKCLDLGANGAEIDVRTTEGMQNTHWSLGHTLYISPKSCDGKKTSASNSFSSWSRH